MKIFLRHLTLIAIIFAIATHVAHAAESLSVLLQKGIFAEETEGNVDAAIKIYEQVATEAAANHALGAQAQFRLAVCYQKKGDKEQAISALNDLVKHFQSEVALNQKARQLLRDLGQAPANEIAMRKLPLNSTWFMAVAPAGQLIAYAGKNGGIDIFETATSRTWTAVKPDDSANLSTQPYFSPDGRQLVYLIKNRTIYVADVDGAKTKQIYVEPPGSGCVLLGWADDGRIIFASLDPKTKMAIGRSLDTKSGAIKELAHKQPPKQLGDFFLSASGRYVAYWAAPQGQRGPHLFILDIETGKESVLPDREVEWVVGWAEHDTRIVFASDRSATIGLWSVAIRDGQPVGAPEFLTGNLGVGIYTVGISRNGQIYYAEEQNSADVMKASVNFETGEALAEPQRVTGRFPGMQVLPHWSKDGTHLALVVPRQPQMRFITQSLAADEETDQAVSGTFTSPIQQVAWSDTDQFRLVQASDAQGQHGIHRFDPATGKTEALMIQDEGKTWNSAPQLALDGKSFFYAHREFVRDANDQGDWTDKIFRRDLQSGKETLIAEIPEKLQVWCWMKLSPDGQRLALVSSDKLKNENFVSALKVIDVTSGAQKELIRLAPRENIKAIAWTPDGKRLVYTRDKPEKDNKPNGPTEVWSIAVNSAQPVRVQITLPRIRNLDIHPDGHQVAIETGALVSGADLWVLDGLLATAALRETKN